jgi:DNA-binding transcriptional regulator YhcF (GntR family)
MPKKQLRQTTASRNHAEPPRPGASLAIPAEAALSFLKDTKGALTWTIRDLAATLNINRSDADRVIALLQAQGYVQLAHANGEWMTTPSGETVSGAKPPRFDRTSVEGALASLQERIKQMNKDAKGLFKVTTAVAFGDFLVKDRARVQAADVGIELSRCGDRLGDFQSASGAREERAVLRELRARTALLLLKPYAGWMKSRSHRNLL